MQAYATPAAAPSAEVRAFEPCPTRLDHRRELRPAILDELVAQLADLVAEKVAARLVEPRASAEDEWLDTRRAAEYLGIHRDSVRRLSAEGVICAEQASAGCKLYFRRSDLDGWRSAGSGTVVPLRGRTDG
jgi:excisionase family DNA binding protein